MRITVTTLGNERTDRDLEQATRGLFCVDGESVAVFR